MACAVAVVVHQKYQHYCCGSQDDAAKYMCKDDQVLKIKLTGVACNWGGPDPNEEVRW